MVSRILLRPRLGAQCSRTAAARRGASRGVAKPACEPWYGAVLLLPPPPWHIPTYQLMSVHKRPAIDSPSEEPAAKRQVRFSEPTADPEADASDEDDGA